MIRITWTHAFNLLWKFLTFAGSITLILGLAEFFQPYLEATILARLSDSVQSWIEIPLFLAGWGGAYLLLLLTILPPWLPDFLYIRVMLRTQVTPEEAKKVCFLFDGSLDGRWYNLKSLRKIDRDQRRDFLFHFANKIGQATGRGKIFHFAESQHESSQQRKEAPPRVDPAAEYLHVLGLTRRPVSVDELKIAYRRKISTFHPDRFANEKPEVRKYAEEMSKRINFAYQWLYERMQAPA